MKNLFFIFIVALFLGSEALAQQKAAGPAKKDTVRDLTKKHPPKLVKGRAARMRMQLEQIRYHDKQLKKVQEAQNEIDRETKSHGDSV
jgi:hypothetical protein